MKSRKFSFQVVSKFFLNNEAIMEIFLKAFSQEISCDTLTEVFFIFPRIHKGLIYIDNYSLMWTLPYINSNIDFLQNYLVKIALDIV